MNAKETYTKEEVAELLEWTVSKLEENQRRYMENEEFLMDYFQLPFWKRWLFGQDIIIAHLKNVILNEK